MLAADLRNDMRRELRGELPAELPIELAAIPHPSRARTRWLRFARPYALLPTTAFGPLVRERARGADVVHFVELAAASLIPLVDRPAVAQIHCLTRRVSRQDSAR